MNTVQEPTATAPIFIVGCHRSGTSLMNALLGRHSQVASMPETVLLQKRNSWLYRALHTRNHQLIAEKLFTIQSVRYLELDERRFLSRFLKYPPDFRHVFQSLLEEYAAKYEKSRTCEKTPDHLFHVPILLQWLPSARVILMIRDGRDVVRSLMQVPVEHNGYRRHCLHWRRRVDYGLHIASRYPRQVFVVRYEELLSAPNDALRKILEFLSLDYEQLNEKQGARSLTVPDVREHWMLKSEQAIDKSRATAWREQMTPQERMIAHLGLSEYLTKLNYDVTPISKPPLFAKAMNEARFKILSILGYQRPFFLKQVLESHGARLLDRLGGTESEFMKYLGEGHTRLQSTLKVIYRQTTVRFARLKR